MQGAEVQMCSSKGSLSCRSKHPTKREFELQKQAPPPATGQVSGRPASKVGEVGLRK